jgi:hypothetical protein
VTHAGSHARRDRTALASDRSGAGKSRAPGAIGALIHLQRSAGNQAVTRFLRSGSVTTPAIVVQRTGAVDDAIAKQDPKAVESLTVADLARATPGQRVQNDRHRAERGRR